MVVRWEEAAGRRRWMRTRVGSGREQPPRPQTFRGARWPAMAVEEASSSSGGEEGSGAGAGGWTRDQEKAFENALATLAEWIMVGEDAMWERIAAAVEGKTPDEVRSHYEMLVEDVDGIEAGRLPLLVYAADAAGPDEGGSGGGKKGGGGGDKASSKSAEQERRKGIAWIEDEHSVPQKCHVKKKDIRKFLDGISDIGATTMTTTSTQAAHLSMLNY